MLIKLFFLAKSNFLPIYLYLKSLLINSSIKYKHYDSNNYLKKISEKSYKYPQFHITNRNNLVTNSNDNLINNHYHSHHIKT
jgi:hypothetical protein